MIGAGPIALQALQTQHPDLCVLNPESEGGKLIRQYVTENSQLSKLNKFVTSRELETGAVDELKFLDGKIAGMQFGYVPSYFFKTSGKTISEDKPVLDYYNKLKQQGLSPEELRGRFMEYYISTPIDKVPAEIRENVKLYRDVNQKKMEYLKKFLNKAKEEGLVQSSLALPAEKAERPSVLAKYAVKAEEEPALKTTTKKAYGDR